MLCIRKTSTLKSAFTLLQRFCRNSWIDHLSSILIRNLSAIVIITTAIIIIDKRILWIIFSRSGCISSLFWIEVKITTFIKKAIALIRVFASYHRSISQNILLCHLILLLLCINFLSLHCGRITSLNYKS